MKKLFYRGHSPAVLLLLLLLMTVETSFAKPALNLYFGSAGDVHAGFSRFNVDCLDPKSDPNARQIMHVGPSVNAIHELGWGDWTSGAGWQAIKDCQTKRLIEAKAHGKEAGFATVDFILFDDREHWADRNKPFTFRGEEVVVPALTKFFAQLRQNGVLGLLKQGGCYIVDEPGLWGLTDDDIRRAVEAVQKAASQFEEFGNCPTSIIYNYGSQPGIKYVNDAGQDHYDVGAMILEGAYYNAFKSLLRPMDDAHPQWMNIVSGGAFGQDPKPFFEKLVADPQIRTHTIFIGFSEWKSAGGAVGYYRRLFSGRTKAGVGVVGQEELAREYCHYGKRIINPDVEHPDCETPPPEVALTVNGEKHVTVNVGEGLYYRWDTTYTHEAQSGRTGFTSYWWSSDPQCSYGLNGGMWNAWSESGESHAVALLEQAGCTYTITFASLGPGQKNSAAAISVTIRGVTNPIRRIGGRGL